MWVRGLKHKLYGVRVRHIIVAPYVGAWIETMYEFKILIDVLSHPMWVRGLKPEGLGHVPCAP